MTDWSTRDMARPNAFVQWKGTNVCMDFYCLCGGQFHLDDDFAYFVKCPGCERLYEMSCMIEAQEIQANHEGARRARLGVEYDPPEETLEPEPVKA